MKKVYLTRRLPPEILKNLNNEFSVEMWDESDIPVPRDVLLDKVKDIDALLCLLTEKIDQEILDIAKNLKIIANMAVGFNNIDINYAKQKGVIVTNTPDVLTETTADLTFGLMLAAARKIPQNIDEIKSNNWKTWSPLQFIGQDVYGSTVGIIGMGKIAQAFAKRTKGFDIELLYYNRSRKLDLEKSLNMTYYSLDELISKSDYIVVLVPYNKDSNNLINKEHFDKMKPNTILINTSRGGIVNEQALFNSLKSKQIFGAGLDVFEYEPLTNESVLLQLDNCICTPHIGSASYQTRIWMGKLAIQNINSVLNRELPLTPVIIN